MTISELNVGDKYEISIKITRQEVDKFANVSGDYSPIHMNEDYAKETKFGKCLVHGMYIGALFSRIIGMNLPGEGTIYISQTLQFRRPVYIGDVVLVGVSVKECNNDKNRVLLETYCQNAEEMLVIGEAMVMPPKC